MADKLYRCKGCGEIDTIHEISLVPRSVGIRPDGEYLSRGWGDECYWEEETIIGVGCDNDKCEYWHGSWGHPMNRDQQPALLFETAPKLEDIAEVVDPADDTTWTRYRNGEGE
ncbi:MAG TPA: hypothetical protein VFX15_03215 [Actinomycetes bacterium]|nr:hypothetical protein [Actinomycetes bacterium]